MHLASIAEAVRVTLTLLDDDNFRNRIFPRINEYIKTLHDVQQLNSEFTLITEIVAAGVTKYNLPESNKDLNERGYGYILAAKKLNGEGMWDNLINHIALFLQNGGDITRIYKAEDINGLKALVGCKD